MEDRWMKTVPAAPETLRQLKGRYQRCLEFTYDADACLRGAITPGEVAANVFDHVDGLRLIVSRERFGLEMLVLHVSATFHRNSRVLEELNKLRHSMCRSRVIRCWLRAIPGRFLELSGDDRPLRYVGMFQGPDGGFPWQAHFVIDLEEGDL